MISDSLAGLTILAFANGSEELFTAVALSNNKQGLNYLIGALFGSGILYLTLVFGLTILYSKSKERKLQKSVF